MGTIRNPAYGIYPKEDENTTTSSVGSLIKQSKNKGDGWWCPYCYRKDSYEWVEFNGHKKEEGSMCLICCLVSNSEMESVKKIMKTK